MKKYRNILLILSVLLLFVGMPIALSLQADQRDAASRDLIASIALNDIPGAMDALKAGADPNARDLSEDDPPSFPERTKRLFRRVFHLNGKPEHPDTQTALTLHLQTTQQDNPLFVKALLDAGADPKLEGFQGDTPLLYAVGLGKDPLRMRKDAICKDSVHLLVQSGANVNAKTLDGLSVLYFAAVQNDPDTVQFLIEHGADVNTQDRRLKRTPLIAVSQSWNVKREQIKMAQVLIDNHTDLNIRDVYGRTALDYARRHRQHQIETLLRQHGARAGQELNPSLYQTKQ